jgi:hypothetical protein
MFKRSGRDPRTYVGILCRCVAGHECPVVAKEDICAVAHLCDQFPGVLHLRHSEARESVPQYVLRPSRQLEVFP